MDIIHRSLLRNLGPGLALGFHTRDFKFTVVENRKNGNNNDDYATKELINAEKACWVLGGSKTGVMTKRAKWAFATKESADGFVSANGGSLISFDDALKASYEDMNADTKTIREKRKMKRMQMTSSSMQQHNH
jgi:nitrous oxide reductase accessory protein NosL